MDKWKPIPGWEMLYEASTGGQIRSRRTGLVLYVHHRKKRAAVYKTVELHRDGTRVNRAVHRLVLETFVGPRPEGRQCRHLNGNPLDNRLENLAWGTSLEDTADRRAHRPDWFLSPEDRAAIKGAPEKTLRVLAAELGCSKSAVDNYRKDRVR